MLDFVQVVSEHMGRSVGLDEDARHWVGVAVRESVINAIKHGNRGDEGKRVAIAFAVEAGTLEVSIRDEGGGFDPEAVPNPTAVENLLKVDGRGIFFMRSFMDDVSYAFPPGGGTIVTMTKRKKP